MKTIKAILLPLLSLDVLINCRVESENLSRARIQKTNSGYIQIRFPFRILRRLMSALLAFFHASNPIETISNASQVCQR